MTATEELLRMLDERGAEWREHEAPAAECIAFFDGNGWHDCWESVDGEVNVTFSMTPEQAIAATLGTGTCHDKGNIERFICSECGCRLDLQDDDWEATMWLADGAAMVPHFCPNCGRLVEVTDG